MAASHPVVVRTSEVSEGGVAVEAEPLAAADETEADLVAMVLLAGRWKDQRLVRRYDTG